MPEDIKLRPEVLHIEGCVDWDDVSDPEQPEEAKRMDTQARTRFSPQTAKRYITNAEGFERIHCKGCGTHMPIGEFVWVGEDGEPTEHRVGETGG